ncbi:MAG: anti-sigma factor [Acidobacteria bacterium]|nr:anti-sigma factor [Acidobacteriota bacterium]
MTPEHDEQALAAFALGALEPAERRAVAEHIAGCDACAAQVRSFQRVGYALDCAVPSRTPPPELRARVLSTITGASLNRRASDDALRSSPAVSPSSVSRQPASLRTWLPLAAMLLIAIGAAAYAMRLQGRVATLERALTRTSGEARAAQQATLDARRIADQARSAMAILAAPDLARIDLAAQPGAPAASARALWSRQRGMVFTAANLPPAGPGRTYQVWVVVPRGPVSAGVIDPDATGSGLGVFRTPADMPSPVAVAVTIEPAGGVPAPTGPRVLVGAP